MLSCPQHHHPSLHIHVRHSWRHSNPTATVSSCLSHAKNTQQYQNPENPTIAAAAAATHVSILRTHNAKSTGLLLHHLKQPGHPPETLPQLDAIPQEEKVKLQEMILITKKRIPQFPGSISQQIAPNANINSPLHTLFRDDNNSEQKEEDADEEMVIRALEIRRKVTSEIFKQAMMKGKFGITYSTNLANKLGDFLDFVMIEAAALKTLPEFEFTSFNVRARTVIDDLKVVPLVRWLKHNHLSYNKIAKLICMSRGNLESIRRLAEWLKSIHVKGDFLGAVLMKAGENILERRNEGLEEIVEYLENNGVRRDWMGYVMSRCPQLLSYSMEEVKIRVAFFLNMGMNEKDFGTMVFEYPRVLGYFTLEEMNQKVNYLKEFGLSVEDVGRLLAFRPHLMGCGIEERWKPLVKYLYYLGISRDGMKRMLIIKPMVFCVELEKTIVPKVRFFQDIGIWDDAIGNMLVKFPPVLTYSLYKKIRPVVCSIP
uniref:Mitochondrial transcription termination factor family protein n=1 Tax=Rhizophora mucronata TaxID=61149 RepID=A0A2P2L454_RHIMU